MYSAVMATRPHEPSIDEALASIAAQTLPPDRVIVVVNGPGSADCALVRRIPADFPGVEVRVLPLASMSAALAAALREVTTRYVAFLDADDLSVREKQERQITLLEAHPTLDAVFCTAVNFRVQADGSVVDGQSATTRMFGATTFRTDVFSRFGLPDADADHFAWLFRWWSAAQSRGVVTAGVDVPDLRRRIHEGNGWVTERAQGRAVLMTELRRIHHSRRAVALPPAGPSR